MELLQLQYFCELAQSQHLTETANKLMVSASSLSHTIKRLETELETPLFDRSGRRIVLNQYGELFYQHASNALNELEAGKRFVKEKLKEQSTVFVGLTNPSIWDSMLADFQHEHPEIAVEVHIIYNEDNLERLSSKLDFFLGNINDLPSEAFAWKPLLPEEQPVIVANTAHPCAKQSAVDLRSLKNETFFSMHLINFSYDRWQKKMFEIAGLKDMRFINGNLLSRIKAVHSNRCIALTTTRGVASNFLQSDNIAVIPLTYPIVFRQQGIYWPKDAAHSPALQTFLDFASHYFH